jgi:hypothetical protein
MTDQTQQLTAADLAQFTGTTQYFKHTLGYSYTDGVFFLAEQGRAYWLLDAIFSYQQDTRITKNPYLRQIQFWELTVRDDQSALLTCFQDTDIPILSQEIPFTDFPLPKVKIYVQNGVALLPSEY